jgi:hypothetical protein
MRHKKGAKAQQTKLEELHTQLETTRAERAEMDKEVSRVTQLVEQGKVRLDTAPKSLMDSLRIIARNVFYRELAGFKEAYNNYRDDHDHYRNLTQSGGILIWNGKEMEVHLTPRSSYEPKLKKLMEGMLEQYNQRGLTMPDGSHRPLKFYLADWGSFEIRPRN